MNVKIKRVVLSKKPFRIIFPAEKGLAELEICLVNTGAGLATYPIKPREFESTLSIGALIREFPLGEFIIKQP